MLGNWNVSIPEYPPVGQALLPDHHRQFGGFSRTQTAAYPCIVVHEVRHQLLHSYVNLVTLVHVLFYISAFAYMVADVSISDGSFVSTQRHRACWNWKWR